MRFSVLDAVFFPQELFGANFTLVIAFKMFMDGENVPFQTVFAGEVAIALITVESLKIKRRFK